MITLLKALAISLYIALYMALLAFVYNTNPTYGKVVFILFIAFESLKILITYEEFKKTQRDAKYFAKEIEKAIKENQRYNQASGHSEDINKTDS